MFRRDVKVRVHAAVAAFNIVERRSFCKREWRRFVDDDVVSLRRAEKAENKVQRRCLSHAQRNHFGCYFLVDGHGRFQSAEFIGIRLSVERCVKRTLTSVERYVVLVNSVFRVDKLTA